MSKALNMGHPSLNSPRVLVLDSDPDDASDLAERLISEGYQANTMNDWDELNSSMAATYDVVIGEAEMTSLEDLAASLDPSEAPAWILLTAFGSIQDAVGAMRAGASDYLTKPFPIDRLLMSLERAMEKILCTKNMPTTLEQQQHI